MTRKINPKSLENLKKRKPFVKGDPRINRLGRASNFDQLRQVFQDIANETIESDEGKVTRLRQIGLTLSEKQMKDFLEFGYGKVPLSQIVDITSGGKPINWKSFIDGNDSDTDAKTNSK